MIGRASMMERGDKFVIRIPDDRKIEIRAEFSHLGQPSENETKRFLLSPGRIKKGQALALPLFSLNQLCKNVPEVSST